MARPRLSAPHARAPMLGAATALFACMLACERPPSADHLSTWSPADHDHAEEQANVASGQQGQRGPAAARGDAGSQTLIEMTWQTACQPCHGPAGRGDGPTGPMVNAPDLTRPELQDRFTDDELAAIITGGRNRMPKFDLPDPVVRGLIARLRAARGR